MKKTPTQTMQTRVTRFLVIFTSVLLLLALLAGCSSGKNKTTLAFEKTDTKAKGGALEASEINKLAEMYATAYSTCDYLIAASRGYNMLDPDFKDSDVPLNTLGTADPVSTAQNVLKQANEEAKKKDESKAVAVADIEKLNAADLEKLISVFQTKIDIEDSSGFMVAIGKFLNWITKYLGGSFYIIGICEFAILIELLMIPFAIRQQKNSIKQAKLRPKEMAIRNKYKGRNDQKTQQQVQREIQELYQRENFSPLSGCLPLLLQMPILIILYRIVIDPLHYVLGLSSNLSGALGTYYTTAKAAGGLGFTSAPSSSIGIISNISRGDLQGLNSFKYFTNSSDIFKALDGAWDKMPNFNIGKFNFGLTPSFSNFNILLLVPVLTFVVYFFSMKLNRKFGYQPGQATPGQPVDRQTACSNTMMDVTMPLMSTFFTFIVPAIIGVYWIFRSILGVLKQFIMSKIMPLPQFTEEDYKAAAKELAGKKQPTVKSANAGKVRSLHHIDDEDFDDTREAALARKAAMEAEERKKQEEAGKSPFESAPIKEDRPERKKKQKAEQTPQENPVENADSENQDEENN